MTDLSMNAYDADTSDLDARDVLLFANDDWQLSIEGLEHRATGYFIERAALSARRSDGLWSWPLQLAEKSWCTPRLFREAFLVALARFGLSPDPALTRSFLVALARFGLSPDPALTRSFAVGFGTRPALGKHDGFVALGELVRPKSAARKRPVEAKAPPRQPVRGRAGERMQAGASA